jgi:hypothetical protein
MNNFGMILYGLFRLQFGIQCEKPWNALDPEQRYNWIKLAEILLREGWKP